MRSYALPYPPHPMYGAPQPTTLSALGRIYSKLFTMTLAFGHPLREGHELFRGRKTVHRYHNGAAPSHHASAIFGYAPSRGGSVAQVFRARSLEMLTITFKTLSIYLRTNLLASGRFITALPRSVLWLYAR